ncbi:unnamed protein product [Meloidogyne enterolobii]|uniref:Uncharacterized protein n=1 Tax=Meloidogyne enterolobii TaxID=390850 RepID=A0ACB0Z0Z1_MELEN
MFSFVIIFKFFLSRIYFSLYFVPAFPFIFMCSFLVFFIKLRQTAAPHLTKKR